MTDTHLVTLVLTNYISNSISVFALHSIRFETQALRYPGSLNHPVLGSSGTAQSLNSNSFYGSTDYSGLRCSSVVSIAHMCFKLNLVNWFSSLQNQQPRGLKYISYLGNTMSSASPESLGPFVVEILWYIRTGVDVHHQTRVLSADQIPLTCHRRNEFEGYLPNLAGFASPYIVVLVSDSLLTARIARWETLVRGCG